MGNKSSRRAWRKARGKKGKKMSVVKNMRNDATCGALNANKPRFMSINEQPQISAQVNKSIQLRRSGEGEVEVGKIGVCVCLKKRYVQTILLFGIGGRYRGRTR